MGHAAPPMVAAIDFEGNARLTDQELQAALPLAVGQPYEQERVEVARKMLSDHYRVVGHRQARVSSRKEPRNGGVAVIFTIQEGPLFRFGKTNVEGLTDFPSRTVYRELTYREGDPFNERELFHTQGRLYNLGIFDDIRILTSTTPALAVDVTIRLKARPTMRLRGGIGYGSEERQRLSLIFTDYNLFHRAYTWETTALYTAISRETRMEYKNRYLFGTRTEHRALAAWRHEEQEGYDFERITAQNSLARRLPFRIYVTPTLRLERTIVFHVSPEISATTPQKSQTNSVETSFARDAANHPFFPTRGNRASVNWERAGGLLGGDIHFNKIYSQAAKFIDLGRSVVIAAQARGGVVWELSPSPEVPIFERFFTGGANSVRGYSERSVGPKDSRGAPLGGNYVSGASLELRFPIARRWNGALFADGGQVGVRSSLKPSEWKYGGGAGVRLVTPVGPLRLDFGYKLNPDPGEENLWRLHLSLGEAF